MCFLWSLGYLLSRGRPALFTCPAAWRPAALRSFASQFCHQRLFLSLGSSLKNVGGRVLTSLTWARCSSLDRVLRGSYPSSSGMRGRGTGRSAPGNGRGARHLTLDAVDACMPGPELKEHFTYSIALISYGALASRCCFLLLQIRRKQATSLPVVSTGCGWLSRGGPEAAFVPSLGFEALTVLSVLSSSEAGAVSPGRPEPCPRCRPLNCGSASAELEAL